LRNRKEVAVRRLAEARGADPQEREKKRSFWAWEKGRGKGREEKGNNFCRAAKKERGDLFIATWAGDEKKDEWA